MDNKIISIILFMVCFISAALVVLNVYEYRSLISEKNINDQQQSHLNATWGKLVLEHQTLTAPANIEKLSRSRLQMVSPTKLQIQYLVVE